MQDKYTQKAKNALDLAKRTAKQLKHGYIGTEHILVGLLKESTGVAAQVLYNSNIEEDSLLDLIEQLIAPSVDNTVILEKEGYTPRAIKVLENSEKEAKRFRSEKVGTEHILIAIVKETDSVAARLLTTLGANMQKIYVEILVAMGEDGSLYKEEFQNGKPIKKKSKLETPTLNQYSRDLTELARSGQLDPVIGREKEIARVVQILSRRGKNNPCLIGEPGVGKTAIAEGLASRMIAGTLPDSVKDKRLVTLDLSGVVAGSKYRGEFEERIKKILSEVKEAGNILLFIDEIHTIIGAGGAEGAIDASNILKPSLARGEIQLIGATTIEEYRKYVEKDAALERRFQPVMVDEPSIEETIEILKGLRLEYENHHNVEITDEGIEAAVKMSDRYINDRFLPDKAIDIIDEASSKLRLSGAKIPDSLGEIEEHVKELEEFKEELIKSGDFEKAAEISEKQKAEKLKLDKMKGKLSKSLRDKRLVVGENEVAGIVSDWTKIPVKKLAEEETERLRRLETLLHKRVIGQEDAVSAVARAIKRGRVGLKDPNRPIGSFLFLGPTGVGKTELSKALAEALFGDEQSMIRVDMSEYMEKHSVSKMIGSPPGYVGYDEGGQLSEKVRRNPYSVILFDEVEKAHPDVFNVLLQVLDDGHITDSQGRKVSFKNAVIIMTSNIGARAIISPKKLGFGTIDDDKKNYEAMKNNVMDEVKQTFKPEFLNRIDETIVFHSLSKEHVKKVVTIMLKSLVNRCKSQMNLDLVVRDSVKKFIAESGYDEKYGARPLRRAIQNNIEDKLAEEILKGTIKNGDTVAVGMKNKQVEFSVNE
ncbi:ATP-dependent Clp protease ATP-binding subunit [Candidatus Galacturonibacter soehngenii]|uniref:ATP-dependent Clp protease ATP-binding subunit n=1 Tax=Candidatus Galacturonatibacter soehngenii TaxID=2307010 RepID=A0A7V7QPA4_9FIRM|nr:ATP-dependent Clp protease ATP-binding subunit [Candidatus Galacturonibacter soehngenii]KAB1441048.1 ATP-dependent Clp protease ATP-binding subunit [Candidatus Galacturonibacter soehngenii]MBA4688381.1 ATP-dependent Clp protease ATP-binding subunit [Candidatus Galacturonibacter soehngenii]